MDNDIHDPPQSDAQPQPPSDPPPADNVVSLDEAKRARQSKRKPTPSQQLPELTGVAQMGADPLLANLRASELSDETIDAARLFTLPSAKWRPFGFRSSRPQSGLLFPFFAPGQSEPHAYRLRPQYPLPAGKRGKVKKYDQPAGTGVLVYMPPLAATLEHLRDLSTPLVWTEGEKKALLLAQLGYCVVGLTGVDCWGDSEARVRGEGRKLHAFIREHYAVTGRQHVIVFDADARTKPSVMQAMQRLAGVLSHDGAASVHMCLPPDGARAKGIDDYAHEHGLDAAANLLRTVREPVEEIEPDLGCVPLTRFGDVFTGSGAERLRMPRGYDVERDGSIWLADDPLDPDAKRLVLDAPMVLARQLTDVYTGTLRSEVSFKDARSAWRSVIVPRERLGDPRSLVASLRPYGALVSSGGASAAARYLDAFERDNGVLLEQARCAAQTGWHEGQFVLPDTIAPEGAERIQLDGSPEQLRMFGSLRPAAGSDVAAHVAALRESMQASSDCALAVYAALSAPLLSLLRQGNYALHLCGDSSRGKTSMLRIAASVFGDPRSTGWVASWNTTLSGLEQRASMLCDLPQFYDEVGVVGLEQAEAFVYTLVNGEGRQRSSKELTVRETLRWRTVVLSTGERELADQDSAATGAQARVINLPVQGFGAWGAADIDAAVHACAVQHGALGRAWLEWLVSFDQDDLRELRDEYEARLHELRDIAVRNGDRLGQRVAGYFAAMAVAEDQLNALHGLGLEGGQTVVRAFAERGADAETRVRPVAERVLDALRDWVESQPSSFPTLTDAAARDLVRVCGYRRDPFVGFLRTPLVQYLRERGLSWTLALQRELRQRGALAVESGAETMTTRFWVGTKHVRVLALRLETLDRSENLASEPVTPNGEDFQ